MAEFVKVFNMKGFDRHSTPRWQMVPVSTTDKRWVALRGGAGFTITNSDAAVVSCTEINKSALPPGGELQALQSGDRILELKGLAKGSARITATKGSEAVHLDINTKEKKTVRIVFNFVEDSASPKHKTTRVPASAGQWIKEMNYIFNGQANVWLENKAARWVTAPLNLGSTITTTQSGTGEEAHLYPLGETADCNYFFVWKMDITDQAGDEDAFAEGKNIVFEDTAGAQVTETMSHELGHVLGLADHYIDARKRELMYGYTDARGVHLGKDDVNTIH
ncbi:MAG: hypothetical protein JNK48_33215 [Bryobacterales bacterium]|nr:hypothetical protein [Bryobacterales bacterium]